MSVTIEKIEKDRTRLKYCYCAVFAYIILSVVTLLRQHQAGLVMVFLLPFLLFLILLPSLRKLNSDKTVYNQQKVYGNYLENLSFWEKNIFSLKDVEEAGLIPVQPKGFLVRRGLRGSFRSLDIEAGEICNYHHLNPEDPKDHNLLFLTGTFVRIRLDHRLCADFRAVSKGVLADRTMCHLYGTLQGLQKVVLPKNPFYEKLSVFTEGGHPVPSQFEEFLTNVNSAGHDAVAAGIRENCLCIFLKNRFLSPAFKATDPVSEEYLSTPACEELKTILDCAASMLSDGFTPARLIHISFY